MLYVASPYTHPEPAVEQRRYDIVEAFCAHYLLIGKHVYSPIVHCHPMSLKHALPGSFEFWKRYNLDMLRRCDQLLVLEIDGWKESKGVAAEIAVAEILSMPVSFAKP